MHPQQNNVKQTSGNTAKVEEILMFRNSQEQFVLCQ